ncbi:MAG: arginyl-tRNA--protein-N-Asp/Glu arginylyltransferase [Pseudohongiellaceae bacterium]|jgi:arginyl-tRNA--protein-N-Asp/Glu arginylyltransferase
MSELDEKITTVDKIASDIESLQFFQTQEHPCSYIKGQSASTLFLNPKQKIDTTLYSQLSEYGFRRSGTHIYKPMCKHCDACIPIRIPADAFIASRQQKRAWRRNQDLSISIVSCIDTDEHYALYEAYINARHQDGDMYPASQQQFRSFLTSEWKSTRYYEIRKDGRLIAASVADIMDNGIAAVYSYYCPTLAKRSLGSFIILFLIEQAKTLDLPAVYLGYWIKSCQKMSYKSSYRPLEIQNGSHWLRVL